MPPTRTTWTNQNAEVVDTRVFSTPRTSVGHAYHSRPVVDSSLGFQLPRIQQCASRLVKPRVEEFGWELWSPNSKQKPYFPGLPDQDFNDLPSPVVEERRVDGHLGPFDFSVNPQYYNPHRPWRGFVLRRSQLGADMAGMYEYQALTPYWEAQTGSTSGRLAQHFVGGLTRRNTGFEDLICHYHPVASFRISFWENRPLYPSASDLLILGKLRSWEATLDDATKLQRGVIEKGAWVAMAAELIKQSHVGLSAYSLPDPRASIPPANDRYIGVWLNTAQEEDGVWLLMFGLVPCFFIHALTKYSTSLPKTIETAPNFIKGTEVEWYTSLAGNPYEQLAATLKTIPHQSTKPRRQAAVPLQDPAYLEKSASRAQGWRLPPPPSRPELAPAGYLDPLWPRSLKTVILATDRVPWIQPPPIAPPHPFSSSKWDCWVMKREVDELGYEFEEKCWIHVAKDKIPGFSSKIAFYDRQYRRRFIFSKPPARPLGLTSPREFGLPVPVLNHYTSGEPRKRVAASYWMYPDRDPARGDAGRVAAEPLPDALPLLKPLVPEPEITKQRASDCNASMQVQAARSVATTDSLSLAYMAADSRTSAPISVPAGLPAATTTASVASLQRVQQPSSDVDDAISLGSHSPPTQDSCTSQLDCSAPRSDVLKHPSAPPRPANDSLARSPGQRASGSTTPVNNNPMSASGAPTGPTHVRKENDVPPDSSCTNPQPTLPAVHGSISRYLRIAGPLTNLDFVAVTKLIAEICLTSPIASFWQQVRRSPAGVFIDAGSLSAATFIRDSLMERSRSGQTSNTSVTDCIHVSFGEWADAGAFATDDIRNPSTSLSAALDATSDSRSRKRSAPQTEREHRRKLRAVMHQGRATVDQETELAALLRAQAARK